MSEYNAEKAREAQEKYCKEKNAPHFAPYNCACWKCNRNIYKQVGWKVERDAYGVPIRREQVPLNSHELEYTTGISVEQAATSLVTGCPHCNRVVALLFAVANGVIFLWK